ncbi:MAG: hypothetical protein AB1403_23215 [Candidatus Riflebacteria bacterium]
MKRQTPAKKANWDRPYKVIFSNPDIAPQEVNNMLETTMKIWADNFIAQGIEKVALKMLARGKSFEEISEATDLTIDQIKALAGNNRLCETATPYKTRKTRRTVKKTG